ncbi:hypothetical protein Efla_002967 [Eimeria flavescens]
MGRCGSCLCEGECGKKLFCGLLLISLFSSFLLAGEEWAFAKEIHKLTPILAELVPSSCVPNPQNDGLYVHLECPVRNSSTFYPPASFTNNLPFFRGVFFEIKAEMFQITRPSRALAFLGPKRAESPTPVGLPSEARAIRPSSLKFLAWAGRHVFPIADETHASREQKHAHSPDAAAAAAVAADVAAAAVAAALLFGASMLLLSVRAQPLASSLRAGGFTLPGSFASLFTEKQQLELKEDGAYEPTLSLPPRTISSQTTLLYENYLYTGNPLKPRVGDVRVSFWGSRSTHVSLIGRQVPASQFGGGHTILDAPLSDNHGAPLIILAEGDYGPRSLVAHRLEQLGFPARWVWTWRLFAFFSLFFLLLAATTMQAPDSEETGRTLPLWLSVVLSALLALSCVLLESACAWWAVEGDAARRLAVYSISLAVAALALRLIVPRCLPEDAAPSGGCSPKYFDLGVSLHLPASPASSTSSPSPGYDPRQQQQQRQQREPPKLQGQVIRWTTSPALPPSTEDMYRRHTHAGATGPTACIQPPVRPAAGDSRASDTSSPPFRASLLKAGGLAGGPTGPLRSTDSSGSL